MAHAGITIDTHDAVSASHGNVFFRTDGEISIAGALNCPDAAMAEDIAATINRHLARLRAERIAAE